MRRTTQCRKSQTGAVAIVVGVCIAVLIGFAGLALDLARLYVNKTELQNAADACALAAARELTCSVAPCPESNLTNARAAGVFVAGRGNRDLQSTPVVIAPNDVRFSTALAPNDLYRSIAEGADATSRYVMCIARSTGIVPWFMGVLGIGAQDVNASAVATLAPAQTNCGIPIALCQEEGQSHTPPFGLVKGKWYGGMPRSGGGLTGNYSWVDFSPPAGGASELEGLLKGAGICDLVVTNPVGQTGMAQGAADAFNSRFGLYKNGAGNPQSSDAPPDYTGFAYTSADTTSGGTHSWPAGADALSDFLSKRNVNAPYGNPDAAAGNAVTGLSIANAFRPAQAPELASSGADRRLVVMPIVDCDAWQSTQTTPINSWACVLLLYPMDGPTSPVWFEYLGLSSDPTSPCATSGSVGGPGSVGPQVPALVQ